MLCIYIYMYVYIIYIKIQSNPFLSHCKYLCQMLKEKRHVHYQLRIPPQSPCQAKDSIGLEILLFTWRVPLGNQEPAKPG